MLSKLPLFTILITLLLKFIHWQSNEGRDEDGFFGPFFSIFIIIYIYA